MNNITNTTKPINQINQNEPPIQKKIKYNLFNNNENESKNESSLVGLPNHRVNNQEITQFLDGSIYSGNLVNGQMCGQGVITYPDGSIYSGNWVNGQFDGQGVMKFPEGSIYSGNWVYGKMSGQGVMTYADGSIYSGNWVNCQMDLTLKTGQKVYKELC